MAWTKKNTQQAWIAGGAFAAVMLFWLVWPKKTKAQALPPGPTNDNPCWGLPEGFDLPKAIKAAEALKRNIEAQGERTSSSKGPQFNYSRKLCREFQTAAALPAECVDGAYGHTTVDAMAAFIVDPPPAIFNQRCLEEDAGRDSYPWGPCVARLRKKT